LNALDAVEKIKQLEIGKKRIICTSLQNLYIAADVEIVSAWDIS